MVGAILGLVGAAVWAVSLALYQQVMEPSGFWVDPATGAHYPYLAANNTYWPREVRQLAILLALASLIAIGRASVRAFVVSGALGLVWLGADVGLDWIDIDGRPAALSLMAAGSIAFTAAALIARGGPPSQKVRHATAGAAALLAVIPMMITNPWPEPLIDPDQIGINNAITAMDMVLAVGLLGAAVTIAAPAITTVRSRWLVLAGFAITLAGVLYGIAQRADPRSTFLFLLLWALALVTVAAANDAPTWCLLVVGGAAVLAVPCMAVGGLIVGTAGGQMFTSLAGNPPVNGADTDIALALPAAAFGLALGLISWALTSPSEARPQAVEEDAMS